MDKKTKWICGLLAILVITTSIAGCMANKYYHKMKIAEHNEIVAKDSTSYYKEAGKTYAIRAAYYENKFKDASDVIDMDDKEIKNLQKKLGEKISYISKLEAEVAIPDTVETVRDSIIYIDKTPSLIYFDYYNDPWLKVKGQTNILEGSTKLYDINIPLPLTVGLTKDYTIFVSSDNPYVRIGNIDAVVLERYLYNSNKKLRNRWSFGVYAGWGIQYGILNRTMDTGPQIGIGATYRIF